ncbi:MAG: hypothetical protein QXK47_05260 [Candidatus Bathyarchaeia archaeon]
MLDHRQIEQNCVRDYRRYSDTVAISCAIYHFLIHNPDIAKFIGIEHKLRNNQGESITPDLVATFDNDRKGLLFELKWSLPQQESLLEKEIKELKKYTVPCSNWLSPSHSVDFHDLILICHPDDAQRVIKAVQKVSRDPDYDFLTKDGFAIWTWTITPSKMGEREEKMRLFGVYGKTRNEKLQNLISQPLGLIFPEEVLTYLRFLFTFIKETPPVQYTIHILIQNIFPTFQSDPEKKLYDIHVDMIYERAKAFFPSWHKFDAETIQLKRKWIKDALEKLYELRLCWKSYDKPDWWKIPIPTLRTRRPIQEVICRKLARRCISLLKKEKRRIGRPKPIRGETIPESQKKLSEFI